MALKGTLRDFGISEILQLIGHQSKTGMLTLKNNEQEVRIQFLDGNVLRAESTTRERRALLGSMLVRAQAVTQQQLDTALDLQKRTLKRLGTILVEAGFLTPEALREFARLQTTETIYKLFLWTSGTYEFTAQEPEQVRAETDGIDPIRAESVLMEGVRMVDEWPLIRRHITSYAMTFKVLKQLPAASAPPRQAAPAPRGDDLLDGLDAAFGAMESGEPQQPEKQSGSVGPSERAVFALIRPGRDVQTLIDLSRLGEFETCKSLLNLVNDGFLEPIGAAATAGMGLTEGGALEPPSARRGRGIRIQEYTGTLLGVLLLAVAAGGAFLVPGLLRGSRVELGATAAWTDVEGQVAQDRIQHALEVFRLARGQYPDSLDALVGAGLLRPVDLHHPYVRPFAYAREGARYQLVRPFH